VLEEVREARAAHALVFRADVKPLVDVNYGQFAVNVQDDLKPVRQGIFLKSDFRDCASIGSSPGLGRWGWLRRRIIAPPILRSHRQNLREQEKERERQREVSMSQHINEGLLSRSRARYGKAGIIVQLS
jgi:hypothetical protein